MSINRLIFVNHHPKRNYRMSTPARNLLLIIMLISATAEAKAPCTAVLHDDITISTQQVMLNGANGQLVITPEGKVWRDGNALPLNAQQRQQAKNYQRSLRETLPWMDKSARQQLAQGRIALDNIIVQQMGSDSRLRQRLSQLDSQLNRQLDQIWQRQGDKWLFHQQAFIQMGEQSQQLLERALVGFMQDSINEITRRTLQQGGNPLKTMGSNLDALQSAIRMQWKQQQKDYQRFSSDICQRMAQLQQQQTALLTGLTQ